MAIILKANTVTFYLYLLSCLISVPFTERFRHITYMELLVKPEILTSYIYGPTFPHNVSTLNQCRKVTLITDGI